MQRIDNFNKKDSWYTTWKCSPVTGERLYSSTEIAENFGISSQLLNKVLVKLKILIPEEDKHKRYKLSDNTLGEECHYSTSHEYSSKPTNNTTNVTIKFSKLGKDFIEYILTNDLKLVNKCDININYNELEKYFPEGDFALAIRKPGTVYNPNPNAPTMIYLSYRTSRNGSDFNRYYMFISNEDANAIRKDMKRWGKERHYNTKGYKMPVDSSPIATQIVTWKDKYFSDVLNFAGYTTDLSEEQINKNKALLEDFLLNGDK